jgi:murein DD-endopeptidase MepM/ murein hydrolase activator NlpD
MAPADGTVTYADFLGGYGRAVVVDHGHGISTRYGHLANFAVISGNMFTAAIPSGTSGLAVAQRGHTSTTKSASTILQSILTNIFA